MKNLILFTLVILPLFLSAQWSTISVPEVRSGMSMGLFKDNLIFAGGSGGGLETIDRIDIYNVNNKTWNTAKLSYSRKNPTVLEVEGKLVIAGGSFGFGNTSTRIDVYDESFELIDTFDLSKFVPYSITAVNDKIYFGYDDRLEALNVNTGEVIEINFDFKRSLYEMYVFGEKLYCIGGVDNDDLHYSDVNIYDLNSGAWENTRLSKACFASSVIGFKNNLFIAGGRTSIFGTVSSRVDIYNVNSMQWDSIDLSEEKMDIASFIIEDKVYFAGGKGQGSFNNSDQIDVYDEATNEWSQTTMPTTMAQPQSVVIGKIAFINDLDNNNETVHIFDPTLSSSNLISNFPPITLQPNPVQNTLNIEGLNVTANLHVKIMDASGKYIMHIKTMNNQIDVSSLDPGMYILNIQTDLGYVNKRFIKM